MSIGVAAGPIDSVTILGEKATLSGSAAYDWDTFTTAYGEGRWDPNKTPKSPRPCEDVKPESSGFPGLEKLKAKDYESIPEETRLPTSDSQTTTTDHQADNFSPLFPPFTIPDGPRSFPTPSSSRIPQPNHQFRKHFLSISNSDQSTSSGTDVRATVATMRWAAAHVDISPLALPSPEHELTDPMRGVMAAIPGSHPSESNFSADYPASPGGIRRTQRLSGFWEGTTDIDDSVLNHTASKMPFATSAGIVESSSGSIDADDAADTDQQILQSSPEESLKPNASLLHKIVLHPASAPVLDARQEHSLVETDYFGDVSDVFPPEHESHTLSTFNGVPPPPPPDLHRNDDSLFDHGPNSVPVPSRPAKLTRPGSSPLPDSSSFPRPLLGEGRVRSESMASLKHQRALKEERRFNELQYLSPPYSADEPDRRRALYK